jgi:hypothetical protein
MNIGQKLLAIPATILVGLNGGVKADAANAVKEAISSHPQQTEVMSKDLAGALKSRLGVLEARNGRQAGAGLAYESIHSVPVDSNEYREALTGYRYSGVTRLKDCASKKAEGPYFWSVVGNVNEEFSQLSPQQKRINASSAPISQKLGVCFQNAD